VTPPNGSADRRAGQTGLEEVELGLIAAGRRLGAFEVGLGGGLVRDQLPGPDQRLLGEIAVGLRLRHLGLEFGVVHLEERGALRHFLAFLEEDRDDPAAHLGAKHDGLHRLDFSGGGDGVDDGVAPRHRHLHQHGRGPAGPRGAAGAPRLGVTLGTGRPEGGEEQKRRVSGHW